MSVGLVANAGCDDPTSTATTDAPESIDLGETPDMTSTVNDDVTVATDVPSLDDVESTDCGRPGGANPDLDYQCDDVAAESCVAINDNIAVCDLGMLMCRCYLCAKGACVQFECDDCGLAGDTSEP